MGPSFLAPPSTILAAATTPMPTITPSVEVNEMGPTIQQGVMQHLVQQKTQSTATGARPKDAIHSESVQQTRIAPLSQGHNSGNITLDPEVNGRDRLPEGEEDSSHNDYVMNCIHESRPFSLSDCSTQVFYSTNPMGLCS